MLSRRVLLLGAAGVGVSGLGAAGLGIHQGVLPGRPWMQAQLGLNGEDGVVPDTEPGPVVTGTFVSRHRLGAETGWALIRPPGASRPLPLVVALHGLSADHARLLGPDFALPEFLAQAVADGTPPFAVATVDGGRSYWHERPWGEDAGAMVTEELLPLLSDRGVVLDRVGLIGWSMGGFGALHLAARLGAEKVRAVVASSPAVWSDPEDAGPSGFEDEEEYEEFTLFGRQQELEGIAVRIDCGTGDPFYRDVEDYVEGFTDDNDLTASFEPGGHNPDYWRRVLPGQLAFLGERVSSTS
ncbi:MAG: esterase family protein [Actinomycetota bacterium]|nr:esterase family protein [Actinomycetota bacterium]